MAEIIRGKYKGQTATINQWCNNWFSVDTEGLPMILSPTSLRLTEEEADAYAKSIADGQAGTMDAEFMLTEGAFKRRKR